MNQKKELVIWTGCFLIVIALAILLLIFFPTLKSEVSYSVSQMRNNSSKMTNDKIGTIHPADEAFGIVIPKIGVNSKIIANVNPFDQAEYRNALKKGVAHAKGTAFPDQEGRVFVFAHSSDNFYSSNQNNTIFYLLRKLEPNDLIDVYYNNQQFEYVVKELRYVDENQIEYLNNTKENGRLVLMTCWPPGTSYKRLLVLAKIKAD